LDEARILTMRRSPTLLAALAAGLILGGLIVAVIRIGGVFGGGPDPASIAAASLQSVREQARLTVLAARFVAVVTSSQSRLGLTAQKTLIMPGMVRYDVDLAKLGSEDLRWDEDARLLRVTIPPLEVSPPQINLAELREYDSGGVLMALTNAEDRLDAANRRRGQQELLRQARQPMPMRLARDAARRAVERSFAMPMKAAGIDAEVVVRFADEPDADPTFLDRSRRIEDVLEERRNAAR
jgi:hypothetical protein